MPYPVGPRSGPVTGRQGTAARSPKRTAGSGDARGRPADNCTQEPVPDRAAADASGRAAPSASSPCPPRIPGTLTAPPPPLVRTIKTGGATPRRRFPGTGASLTPAPATRAPRPSPAGPFVMPAPRCDRRHTGIRAAGTTPGRPRRSNQAPDQEDGGNRGTCVRRGTQVPVSFPPRPLTPSCAAPRAPPAAAAAAPRRRPPGPREYAAPPLPAAGRRPPAPAAGPPRPCSASTPWPARPAR